MQEVIFLFNLLRAPFENSSVHVRYAKHIMELFEWQIKKVSGKSIRFISSNLESENGFDREKFYNLMGIEYIEENWVKIYDLEPTPEAIEYLASFVGKGENNLVLSYEICPTLVRILDILKINYIDIRVGSIKYLDDLIFGFQTNNSKIFEQLLKHKVSESQFEFEAALLKSRLQLVNQTLKNKIEKNSAIFAGQTVYDASLIRNNKLLTILDFKEEFKAKAEKYDVIYYQKHPMARDDNSADDFIFSFPNVKTLDANLYYLMCAENIEEIFSISSGSIQEAQYFGKKNDYFFRSMYQFVKDDETQFTAKKYVSIYRKYLEPNFWADILKPLTPTQNCNQVELAPNQSRVRYLHNIYWGYDSLIRENNVFYKDSSSHIKDLDERITKLNNKRIGRKLKNLGKLVRRILLRINNGAK